MDTKICFKCNAEKPLSEYYPHKQMGDGHLNKCKECTKKDTANRRSEKLKDPEWVWKERERCRLKQKKYIESGKAKVYEYKKTWNNMEVKRKAGIASQRIPCPKESHKHHWSYNEDHWKDVIILAAKDHYKIHRYTVFDPERLMYRTIHGRLLDTREVCEEYYKYILSLPEGQYPEK